MKKEVRFYTRSGNAKKLADAVANALNTMAKDASYPMTEKADVVFLCSSLYGGKVDEKIRIFLSSSASNIGMVVNLSTSGFKGSTYKAVKKICDEYGIKLYEEEFSCKGKFLFLNGGRPNGQDLDAASKFVKQVVAKIQ